MNDKTINFSPSKDKAQAAKNIQSAHAEINSNSIECLTHLSALKRFPPTISCPDVLQQVKAEN